MIFVNKNYGSWRCCIDYQLLNKATITNQYMFPRINDLLYQIKGAKAFCKIDVRYGYHQLWIREKDIPKMQFGHYESVVVPFELTNASSLFMSLMNIVFQQYLDKFIQVFLDDIMIYSRTSEEYKEDLRQVL